MLYQVTSAVSLMMRLRIMNKIRLNQILDLLLLPFCSKDFLKVENDVLFNHRFAYYMLSNRTIKNDANNDYLKAEYNKKEENLTNYLRVLLKGSYSTQTVDDTLMLLDYFYPNETACRLFTFNEVDAGNSERGIDCMYFNTLRMLANSLLTFRNGKVAIKTWYKEDDTLELFGDLSVLDKVELWSGISRRFSCDTIIAMYLAECNRSDYYYAINQNGYILLADKALETVMERGIAETHVHFNAGANDIFFWLNWMHPDRWLKCLSDKTEYLNFCKNSNATFPVFLFRLLWAEYLHEVFTDDFTNLNGGFIEYCENKYGLYIDQISSIFEMMYRGSLLEWSPNWFAMLQGIIIQQNSRQEPINNWHTEIDYLTISLQLSLKGGHLNSEMLLLLRSFSLLKKGYTDGFSTHLFLQYLRCKNFFIQEFAQNKSTEGLIGFQYNYKQTVDTYWMRHMESSQAILFTFRSFATQTHLRKLEFRITPPLSNNPRKDKYKNSVARKELKRDYLLRIKSYLSAYRTHLLDFTGIPLSIIDSSDYKKRILKKAAYSLDELQEKGVYSFPTIGILFHFVKRKFIDDRMPDICWLPENRQLLKNADNLICWRENMVDSAEAIEELRSSIPLLADYVVGIDAASIENDTEPWVFAPVFAGARNHHITNPILLHNNQLAYVNNIGFTYHVGEEFRHLLTGFRHVDEIVTHFSYKAGDRLGHAIALGTDIEYWAATNEIIPITYNEYLDDLLWLWGKIVYDDWDISISVPYIEAELMKLVSVIYNGFEPESIKVSMLYSAYIKKFKGDFDDIFMRVDNKYISNYVNEDNHHDGIYEKRNVCATIPFCKYANKSESGNAIWNAELIFCTWFCPIFKRRLKNTLLLPIKKNDVRVLQQLQELLIERIAKEGIYVEANPTSNMLIGSMDEMKHHPIFNLYEKGLKREKKSPHEIMVTINSDDPAVFHTNTENEFAYVYHALSKQGYNKDQILSWMDQVRKMGINSSFIKKEKKPSQMLFEITELIKEIDNYMMLSK